MIWAFADHRSDPRPMWLYAWLSFAVYEGVATLLTLVVWPLDNSRVLDRAPLLTVFVPLLLAMSFLPVVGVSIWASLRSRQTAVYTFFPYAAATVPLFVLSGITPLFTGTEPLVLPSTLSLLATAAFAIFFDAIPSPRIRSRRTAKCSTACRDNHDGGRGSSTSATGASGFMRHFCAVPLTTFRWSGMRLRPAIKTQFHSAPIKK